MADTAEGTWTAEVVGNGTAEAQAAEELPVRPDPMPRLTLPDIVAAQDLGTEEVPMPEWGGTVEIRGLGYGEWVDVRNASALPDGAGSDERMLARQLFSRALTDPVVSPEQADLLIAKSATAVNRLVDRIIEVSGVDAEALLAAEATFPG